MATIKVQDLVGTFAENKDIARDVRENFLIPATSAGELVSLDFTGIDSSTQSFVHALISEIFQTFGEEALDKFEFIGCGDPVRSLITTVINYSLE